MDTLSRLSNSIKTEAARLGFSACGIAKAGPVDKRAAENLARWTGNGGHAGMDYMARNTDKRLDPTLLMPGAVSIVSVALNYAPQTRMPSGEMQIAAYAYGQDYHHVVKGKLREMAAALGFAEWTEGVSEGVWYRAFCDSAPILERYWAEKAGIGWTGRNHQLIIPRAGSMFFLGELLLSCELAYDKPMENRCGNCQRCITACPTKAIAKMEDGTTAFASEKCLSYQTIENRGEIPPEIKSRMGGRIYGCDECIRACPWNRFSHPTSEESLKPSPELLSMKKADWLALTPEKYASLFKGSAVKRAKYQGLVRNIRAAME